MKSVIHCVICSLLLLGCEAPEQHSYKEQRVPANIVIDYSLTEGEYDTFGTENLPSEEEKQEKKKKRSKLSKKKKEKIDKISEDIDKIDEEINNVQQIIKQKVDM